MTNRLSVDIGGTFTDVVLDKAGELVSVKVLTTYDDPASGVMQGIADVLQRAAVEPGDVSLVLHGTTLATNALIERRGAPTALLTTEGHRDALEMAFENRFEQYDVNIDRPAPLVPRYWRVGVEQRNTADGAELTALNETQVLAEVEQLVEQGVQALAIGFLHSYAAPQHEQRAAELIAHRYPEISLSLSCDVCPEIREYERLSTTVANAYVKPLMATYLASLQQQLQSRGFTCQVLMMTSGGGLTTLDAAARYPIRLVESGPAGGAILAARLARDLDLAEVLSFDMGGTTAKICLIDNGEPLQSRAFEVDRSYRFKKGSGLPVRIPVIEMVEIGAGGGSIARVDGLRRIHVGPESAGSEPGPACYGLGGNHATVTDADTVLGRLTPDLFAGGKLTLRKDAAVQALLGDVGEPLSMTEHESAFAVSEIVEENMASAARAHASEWGKAVQGRTMIAFGGAAPLHAVGLARKLKIERVLVPAGAGVGSAIGFLLAPVRFEVVRSFYCRLGALEGVVIKDLFDAMRSEAAAVISDARPNEAPQEIRQAFMRYVGQGYEVAVDLGALDYTDAGAMREQFESAYQQLYGRTIPGMDVEILSWTLALSTGAGQRSHANHAGGGGVAEDLPPVQIYDGVQAVAARMLDRSAGRAGNVHRGPALVIEAQTTTVVPADCSVTWLADGTLDIRLT